MGGSMAGGCINARANARIHAQGAAGVWGVRVSRAASCCMDGCGHVALATLHALRAALACAVS